MLDPRLLRITIFLSGVPHVFERLAMSAKGTKYTSEISNVCEIRIANIDKQTRDKLLSEGTPYSQLEPPKNSILIEAGRESTGLHQIFVGDITTVNVTQAPDIWLTMRAITGKLHKNETGTLSQNATAKFSLIAKQSAEALELTLDFRATDKDVANFSFSGSLDKLVSNLGEISSGVDAYVDDDTLVVKPRFEPSSPEIILVDIDHGLIGIPEFVDLSVRCVVLLTSEIRLGQTIRLSSEAYPATNGDYIVYQLRFDLANRDSPFYYIVTASDPNLGQKAA